MDICNEIRNLVERNLPQILALRSTGHLKEDGTFVSEGDLLCESLVRTFLEQHVEGCKLISEESPNDCSDLDAYEYVVTVDPIDGTENFVSGLKEWGVGVSVYRRSVHFQSMILLPQLGICLTTGDRLEQVPHSRICGLSSYMKPEDFEQLGRDYEYRIFGCCMYNMYNAIKGSYARFQHLKGCYSWDILPGLNLALEHGLQVILDGKPYAGEFLPPNIRYRFTVSRSRT